MVHLNPPMVLIEWDDSAQALSKWQWLNEVEPPPILRCKSVGFLVKNTKREKCLAISLAGVEGEPAEQVSGIISIPTKCVVSMKKIKATVAKR